MDVPHVGVEKPRARVPVHDFLKLLLKLVLELILPTDSHLMLEEECLETTFHHSKERLGGIELRSSCWEVVWPEVVLDEVSHTSGFSKVGRVPVHDQNHSLIWATVSSHLQNVLKERNELDAASTTASPENGALKDTGMADTAVDCNRLKVFVVLWGVHCTVGPLPGLCLEIVDHHRGLIDVTHWRILVDEREQFPSSLSLLPQVFWLP